MANRSEVTIIGRAARVRGRVTGAADLEIQGFVEGEVIIDGDVTVEDGGKVGASIRGRLVTVRGAVRGDVHGEEAVRLEASARVVGDIRSPRIAIAVGAKVRGNVQTSGSGGAAPSRASRPAARAEARPESRPAAAPAHVPAPASVPARREAPASAPAPARAASHAPQVRSVLAGARSGPPAPVVPVLKKAKGQLTKKRGE